VEGAAKHFGKGQALKPFYILLPSPSLTWNLKMAAWNRIFLLETIIFRFHVKLGEGKCKKQWLP